MHTTRRQFLKSTAGASALLSFAAAVPRFVQQTGLATVPARRRSESVLVVIQLSGGNDGLNTVIPYENEIYHRHRPTLRLAAKEVLKLDAQLGLHPVMPAFQRLYQDGLLSIVQGVGYPNSNRNHPTAMRDWQTARPKEPNCQTGWLGRAIDRAGADGSSDVAGLFVGHIREPLSLQAERTVTPTIRSLDQAALSANSATGDAFRERLLQGCQPTPDETGNSLLQMLRRTTVAAGSTSRRVEAASQVHASGNSGAYPPFRLAQTLQTVAHLIRADVGVRIYFAELGGGGIGGFDSHANQAANHGALLRELSESVAAFTADLQRDNLHDQVLLMTFSEFGRTVAENGRRGTDHGAAAPLFLAGGRVKAGFFGEHPSLTDLQGDALKFQTDFRSVYATILDQWLEFDSEAILGERFQSVDILKD